MIKRVPIPIAGVMLGTAALGNLLQSYSESVRLFCGVIAFVLGILFLVKFIFKPSLLAVEMKNPIMASIAATFPMALMLLSAYAKPYIGAAALYAWYVAVGLHVILILYFTITFIIKLDVKKVFASYFIPYVGIAVGSVSAPAFGQEAVGTAIFWFAFVCLLILLVLIAYRYIKFREVPPPAQPLFCIFAAPASLCLAGYISSVAVKSKGMVIFLAILATLLYLLVLSKLPKYLTMPFFPSYAAFTFPFVISAIAIKQTFVYLGKINMALPWLSYVVLVETIIASALVVYVIIRYAIYLFSSGNQ